MQLKCLVSDLRVGEKDVGESISQRIDTIDEGTSHGQNNWLLMSDWFEQLEQALASGRIHVHLRAVTSHDVFQSLLVSPK